MGTIEATSMEFGYYPRDISLDVCDVVIRSLPTLEATIKDVPEFDTVDGDWIYAPLRRTKRWTSKGSIVVERPYSQRVFSLPKTHSIRLNNSDNIDKIVFYVWSLSFFTGIRLTTTEAGFLDATPIRIGKLVDFILDLGSLSRSVELTDQFWQTHSNSPKLYKLYPAAIHALFLSQNPQLLSFERFDLLYKAIDACFCLASSLNPPKKRPPHVERIEWLCDLYGIPTPKWTKTTAIGNPAISVIRNDLVHEALYIDEPLGFAISANTSPVGLNQQLEALLCRFLVAIIGASSTNYVSTPIDSRQRHGLDLL